MWWIDDASTERHSFKVSAQWVGDHVYEPLCGTQCDGGQNKNTLWEPLVPWYFGVMLLFFEKSVWLDPASLKQLYHTISDFQWGCRSEQAGWCTDEATGWFTVVCFGKSLTKPCSHTASSTPTTDLRHYFIQPCHRSTCTEIFVLQPLTGHFVYY